VIDTKEVPVSFTFGIYAGSAVGEGSGLRAATPDDPWRIRAALDRLQGAAPYFLVRGYLHYIGAGQTAHNTPLAPEQYATSTRKVDLAFCHQTDDPDLSSWIALIEETIQRHTSTLGSVQIAEEVNVVGQGQDGDFANSTEALVAGVIAAKAAAVREQVEFTVGFNAAPSFGKDPFWPALGALATDDFRASIDYVGLDFFPDVFRPIASERLDAAISFVLDGFRAKLDAIGIPRAVPIRITENGWPTGPGRSPERQRAVLEAVVRAIYARKDDVRIDGFIYHSLRDTESANPTGSLMAEFGMMDDDYVPKPAFETYRRLIAELTEA
jgi:hypothetical protein